MSQQGFLAIWCQIPSQHLQDYRNWLTQEHISDRIYSPGFLGVRLFSAVENECSHFFLYITDGPEVMKAAPYLHILNNPSPWTKRIMPMFGPFDRAVGQRLIKIGRGFGSHVLVSRVRAQGDDLDIDAAKKALTRFIELPSTVGVRLLRTDRSTADIRSEEKTMRVGIEGDFDYLLVVEATDAAGAESAKRKLADVLKIALPDASDFDASVHKVIYGEAPYEAEVG